MCADSSRDAPASPGDDSTDDAILRRIARAPVRPPPSDPARISRFRIEGRLGAGGMGVVYRAIDEQLGREVAVKVMPAGLEESGERRRRFVTEARAAAAINHPNVATVYEVGEADGRVFIAMELVPGESLRRRLSRSRVPMLEARDIAHQILTGLAAAHHKGIVHRDLKPDNVMLSPSGVVKILDFGLAKLVEPSNAEGDPHATEDGRVLGTPGYMSPEQARGLRVDARSDVFAFGAVLYEILAGARPFQGDTPVDVIASVVRDRPVLLRERDADIPPALERIVMRCLEKAPDDRYASAQAVLDDLARTAPLSDSAGPLRLRGWVALAATLVALGIVAILVRTPARVQHPAPRTATSGPTSPTDASRELAAAVLAVREGNPQEDRRRFAAIVAKYPDASAAHLRLAITDLDFDSDQAAAEYRTAFEGRTSLDAFGADLLQAFEPRFHVPSEIDEHLRRIQSLAERFTDDAFLAERAGWLLLELGRGPEALAAFDHALAVDPAYVPALAGKVRYLMDVDAERSRALADACVASSPEARMCLEQRWHLAVDDGRCKDAEADTRRIQALDPRSPGVYYDLAQEMVALGEPLSATEEALARRAALLPDPDDRFVAERWGHSLVAVLRGDFGAALASLEEVETFGASHPSVSRSAATLERLDILFEVGDAAASAREFEVARAQLRLSTSEPATDSTVSLARFELHAGRAARPAVRALEDQLFQSKLASLGQTAGERFGAWCMAYAAPVLDEADAKDALDAFHVHDIQVDALALRHTDAARFLGKVYALAGRSAEAIPLLERATRSCHPFQDVEDTTRASFWLGMAREAVGDRQGARDAYASVLARWGHARPRSVFGERAREGLQRLTR